MRTFKHLLRICLSGLATWTWVGLFVLKFLPYAVEKDWAPFYVFVGITIWTLILVLLVFIFAGFTTAYTFDRDR